ncbi:MAG: DUF5804 family protein [Methanomicrobiales archaeon]|nr:DUF5804 family protein [Methanomicrobiales archaeon]
MKILLVPRPGVDLYRTLYDSETSRAILRFYKPGRHPWGVEITVSSLGSAVSLISELRWYVQRYIQEILIDVGDGVVISRALAREVYQRDLTLTSPWPHRMRFRLERGRIRRSLVEPPGEPGAETPAPAPIPVSVVTEPGAVPGTSAPAPVPGTPDAGVSPVTREPVPVPAIPEPGAGTGSPEAGLVHVTPEPAVVPVPVAPEAITIEVWTTPDEPVEDVVAEEEPAAAEGEPAGEEEEGAGEKGKEGG